MTNAKTEFLEHTGCKSVRCARVIFGNPWHMDEYPTEFIKLQVGYTQSDLENFLCSIDKEYNSGYGDQELFGTIWYTDGTWSSRGEYDGSEWWDYNAVPEIPEGLQ